MTWDALIDAVRQAGPLIADDTTAVYGAWNAAEDLIVLRAYKTDEPYGFLTQSKNREVEVVGCSAFVNAHNEEEPLQLTFTKHWVISDDLTLTDHNDE